MGGEPRGFFKHENPLRIISLASCRSNRHADCGAESAASTSGPSRCLCRASDGSVPKTTTGRGSFPGLLCHNSIIVVREIQSVFGSGSG